ncbi:MAG TPA: cytochrome c3 family protein [Geobacteraceae bacterium]|nr:cytochrome c3 family protein [Geobacteraceae bacterium]
MKVNLMRIFILAVSLWPGAAPAVVGGGDVTMKAGEAGDVVFSHDLHVVSLDIGCKECHTRLYLDTKRHKKVTMEQMEKGKSCGACHNGDKAFSVKGDCDKCHGK